MMQSVQYHVDGQMYLTKSVFWLALSKEVHKF